MAKIQNKMKAKKFLAVDKVARRTLKAQKAFDKANEQREADKRDLSKS